MHSAADDLTLARLVLAAGSLADAQAAAQAAMAAPRFVPLKVAAHLLRLSSKTVRRRVHAGAGEFVDGRWIVDLDAVRAMGRRAR